MIGNPFAFDIPYQNLTAKDLATSKPLPFQLMSYEGKWELNQQGLQPWKGYAIYVHLKGILAIQPGVSRLNNAAHIYTTAHNTPYNWMIQITAATAHSEDHFNFAGQHQQVWKKAQAVNMVEPPRLPKQVSLTFSNPGSDHEYTTDIRQPSANGHRWNFTCRVEAERLSLGFKGLTSIPSDFKAVLVDLKTHTRYPLYGNPQLDFMVSRDSERDFQLWVGNESFLNHTAPKGNALPKRYQLAQNFPNPFNASTQIVYSLPEKGHVLLQVYDNLGRLVSTLVDKVKIAGRYPVVWNAGNAPSGIYIYRLQTGKFQQIKKCLLIK